MTIYFGFTPTDELNAKIDDSTDLIKNRSHEIFYPYQQKITQLIAHELIEQLFVKLVDVIDDPKQQKKMYKLIDNINSAIDSMLKHIVTKQENKKILDSFHFLHDECVFMDNDGQRRVGFKISDEVGHKLTKYFNNAKNSDAPHTILQEAMDVIIKANLHHFVGEFTQHLHLNLLKRKAVPLAESAINKACQMAVHKLLPSLEVAACMRLVDHFEKFLVVKAD